MKHNLKYKLHELSVVVPLLNTTQNVVILRCDGKEIYRELLCTCRAIFVLIKSF